MTDNNTIEGSKSIDDCNIEHDLTDTDTKDYTLVYTRDLTQLDKKLNPDYINRIYAILKSNDTEKERPYLLALYYNEQTGEYEYFKEFKTLIEAKDRLKSRHDYICPIKVLAHKDNTACDFEDCVWYVKDDDTCAFTVQAQRSRETNEMLRQISDRLASIDDTLLCQ